MMTQYDSAQIYGTQKSTERHAFFKRKKCIRTTDSKHSALEPDTDGAIDGLECKNGVASETKDTPQVG